MKITVNNVNSFNSLRILLHRKFRHNNRIALKKCLDIEIEPKTRGWITF